MSLLLIMPGRRVIRGLSLDEPPVDRDLCILVANLFELLCLFFLYFFVFYFIYIYLRSNES